MLVRSGLAQRRVLDWQREVVAGGAPHPQRRGPCFPAALGPRPDRPVLGRGRARGRQAACPFPVLDVFGTRHSRRLR